jgi:protein tyrosine phosphatase (PTP) superfamily phosphohydrolase (DUF442 family)
MRRAATLTILTALSLLLAGGRELAAQRVDAKQELQIEGANHVYRLGPELYSGSEPEGRKGLEALARLGVKTIISVDGAAPDVEAARELGMRYVHLPIGYDGVPDKQGKRIAQAAQTVEGPIYFHCHHGQHRGPTAAALAAMSCQGWSAERAVDWMKTVGTSADYPGLYESVRTFRPPTPAELAKLPRELPERVKLPPLATAMARLDRVWDRARFSVPTEPAQGPASREAVAAALALQESFRELLRSKEVATRNEQFMGRMQTVERQCAQLYALLKQEQTAARLRQEAKQLKTIKQSCNACHARNRN